MSENIKYDMPKFRWDDRKGWICTIQGKATGLRMITGTGSGDSQADAREAAKRDVDRKVGHARRRQKKSR